jgi:ATP-dependent Clp protease ATP-binding subunit ClpC
MFSAFTERAVTVMRLANEEAGRMCHEYIGTEHILLGLVRQGTGVGARVLQNLGIDLDKVRHEVEKIIQSGPGPAMPLGKLPQTPKAKKVIEYAMLEAKDLGANYVGTEHLLLGLLRDNETVAAQVLAGQYQHAAVLAEEREKLIQIKERLLREQLQNPV